MSSATLPNAALPIFDFSKFVHGMKTERQLAASEIVSAFKTYGFVYLVNHGLEKAQDDLFDWVSF